MKSTVTRSRSETRSAGTEHISRSDIPLPFRWDVTRSHRLGKLIEGGDEPQPAYPGYIKGLLDCAARSVAHAGDADLVFVGRSPESLFDLLSGLLANTEWKGRCTLLQFSVGYTAEAVTRRTHPESVRAFRAYLDSLALSPDKITVRERPVAFIDLICGGSTMHHLLTLIHDWAVEVNADWPAIRRKIRVVGIVRPSELRPLWKRTKPWSWKEESAWIGELLEHGALREVSIDRVLWSALGDTDANVTPSYTPERWGRSDVAHPCHEERRLSALRAARKLYEMGCESKTRLTFAKLLACEAAAMREPWARALVQELRQGARPTSADRVW